MYDLSWLNPTPHATALYACCAACLPPHATLASRRPATALPGLDFHQLIAPALAGAFSLDYLVGACRKRGRHIDAERLRSFEIDDELKLSRLHGGKLGRLGTLENAPGIDSALSKSIGQAGS